MDKKVLNERLNELIRQIKLNSKDSHFAEKLTDDLLSVHRQKLSEKKYVFDVGDETYRIEKSHYYLANHERGIIFHIYNAFDLVITPSSNSLYGTLRQMLIEHQDNYELFSDEEKSNYDTFLDAATIVLTLPLNAFIDVEHTLDLATYAIQQTEALYQKAIDTNLQPETIDKDIEFKDYVLRRDELTQEIDEDVKAIRDGKK
jgi:hypothetical protein